MNSYCKFDCSLNLQYALSEVQKNLFGYVLKVHIFLFMPSSPYTPHCHTIPSLHLIFKSDADGSIYRGWLYWHVCLVSSVYTYLSKRITNHPKIWLQETSSIAQDATQASIIQPSFESHFVGHAYLYNSEVCPPPPPSYVGLIHSLLKET